MNYAIIQLSFTDCLALLQLLSKLGRASVAGGWRRVLPHPDGGRGGQLAYGQESKRGFYEGGGDDDWCGLRCDLSSGVG